MVLGYYIFRGIAWLVSLLPFWLLQLKSDIFFFLLYHVIRYRKKVVFRNLRNSFPDKPQEEIKAIARKFYHNLSDIIFENIKIENISLKGMKKRYVIENPEVLEKYNKEGRGAMLLMGHLGNWEWSGTGVSSSLPQPVRFVVKRLSDPNFNRYIESLRCKFFSGITIPHKMTMRYVYGMQGKAFVLTSLADQTPSREESKFWTTFLKQETIFFEGPAKIAKRLEMPVVFMELYRAKRSYYRAKFTLLSEDASKEETDDIVLKYVQHLEDCIMRRPDNWLWSHKRWKHQRQDEPLKARL